MVRATTKFHPPNLINWWIHSWFHPFSSEHAWQPTCIGLYWDQKSTVVPYPSSCPQRRGPKGMYHTLALTSRNESQFESCKGHTGHSAWGELFPRPNLTQHLTWNNVLSHVSQWMAALNIERATKIFQCGAILPFHVLRPTPVTRTSFKKSMFGGRHLCLPGAQLAKRKLSSVLGVCAASTGTIQGLLVLRCPTCPLRKFVLSILTSVRCMVTDTVCHSAIANVSYSAFKVVGYPSIVARSRLQVAL